MHDNTYMGRGANIEINPVSRSDSNQYQLATAAVSALYCSRYGEPLQELNRLVFIDRQRGIAFKLPLTPSGYQENLREKSPTNQMLKENSTQILQTPWTVSPAPIYDWDSVLTELDEAGVTLH